MDQSNPAAGAMPAHEIQAKQFIDKNPSYDGRHVVVAILDTGVDPGAAGLQVTSDGRPKIIDVMDCSGSGDVDMRTKVKADEDLIISSVSGRKLKVNASWTNPSGEWRVGSKHLYSLIPAMLVSRLKEEKKRQWEEKHRQAMVIASQPEGSSPSSLPSPSGSAKQKSAELDARVTFLKEAEKAREDLGPLIEVVTWHDGSNWRVALDTSELAQIVKESKLQAASEGPGVNDGALANFAEPLTDYKTERKFGTFSALDSCHYAINILSNGDVVSIVVDAGAHGTHVAGIVGAYFPDDPSLNGIAPGCQIISLKIGDTRLGSMETGTALTRAFIAAKEAGVDLINMSYGEPTSTPNAGRLVELANELVEEHGIIFVASAGNSGPALSTVGAPGGTSSSILGIGAYVSPSLAEAGHSVRSLPPSDEAGNGGVAGQQYTWSSRGPTMDGDLGVNFSAPGGAIAPVPSWCLAKRQLMNGTSMASPNACGGIALVLSALKQEQLHGCHPSSPSPSSLPALVRRAIENSCLSLGQPPAQEDNALTYGRGLIQVQDAFEYLKRSSEEGVEKLSIVYSVSVSAAGGGPAARGIYIRQAQESIGPSSYSITVMPSLHSSKTNEERLEIEDQIVIESTEPWISCPSFLLLHNASRSFEAKVDPSLAPKSEAGLAYAEVLGYDSKARWRGPLFRVPVTLIAPQPMPFPPLLPELELGPLSFSNGSEVRRFIDVPLGASWAEVTIKAGAFDTPKTFLLRATQLQPQLKKNETTKSMSIGPNSMTVWNIGLVPGSTLEITLAQFWSSLGDSVLDSVFISFHGLMVEGLNPSGSEAGSFVLDPSLGFKRLLVRAPLRDEKVKPDIKLDALSWTIRPEPSTNKPEPLSTPRDTLWDSRVIYAFYLNYKLTAVEGGKFEFSHGFNGHVYDGEFEGQMLMIHEKDGKMVGCSDIYPKSFSLKKGVEYSLRLMLRHDKRDLLASMSGLPLNVKRKLEAPLSLPVYSKKNSAITSSQAISEAINVKASGIGTPLFIGALADDKTLPKDATTGRALVGKISLGQVLSGSCPDKAAVGIAYILPPPKPAAPTPPEDSPTANAGAEPKDNPEVLYAEALRDAKIKHMKELKISAPFYVNPDADADVKPADRIYRSILEELTAAHPKHLPLLTQHLTKIDGLDKKVQRLVRGLEAIVAAADLVIDAVDPVAINMQLGMKCPPDTAENKKAKKEAEEAKSALIEALSIKCKAMMDIEELTSQAEDSSAEVFLELRKWEDTGAEIKHALLHARFEARAKRLASALQFLDKALASEDVKSGWDEIRALKMKLLGELGWEHLVSDEQSISKSRTTGLYNSYASF